MTVGKLVEYSNGVYEIVHGANLSTIDLLQLPVLPVYPDPTLRANGTITWNLGPTTQYSNTMQVIVDAINPSDTENAYIFEYYYLASDGVVLGNGYIVFQAGSFQSPIVLLPAKGDIPLNFILSVNAPANTTAYTFGIRMLLCEHYDVDITTYKVIAETCRLQTSVGGTEQASELFGTIISGVLSVMVVAMMSTMVVKVAKN